MTETTPALFAMPASGGKPVIAAFDGGAQTCDIGVALLAAVERRFGFIDRLAELVPDRRALDREVHRARRFRLDPVAEAAQRSVGGKRRADAGGQRVEGDVTGGTLNDSLDLGAVLVVVGKRRQRNLGLAWFAIAQDQQPLGWNAFGKHVAAERGRWQRREPRVQRGDDVSRGLGMFDHLLKG